MYSKNTRVCFETLCLSLSKYAMGTLHATVFQ